MPSGITGPKLQDGPLAEGGSAEQVILLRAVPECRICTGDVNESRAVDYRRNPRDESSPECPSSGLRAVGGAGIQARSARRVRARLHAPPTRVWMWQRRKSCGMPSTKQIASQVGENEGTIKSISRERMEKRSATLWRSRGSSPRGQGSPTPPPTDATKVNIQRDLSDSVMNAMRENANKENDPIVASSKRCSIRVSTGFLRAHV